ncbi:hypothetical protein IFR05_011248 [Cadophora sp. M221]|nr:hypothetical protein IFR05_011248 [Cadophora sp. M221]
MEIGFEESMVVGASDAHESQALLPHRQAQNTHLDALLRQGSETQKHDNAFTDHDESDIWMKFEVRRRSANFYLDEYLQARAVVDNLCVSDNQSQSIALPGQESPASRSYWRMKAARDNLLQDLRTLCCLLETISPSTAALFAKSCIFPLFL